MRALNPDLALQLYQRDVAREHPRYLAPFLKAPDSRSGEVFQFATVLEDEAHELRVPFHGVEFPRSETHEGESSWLWQRDYLNWIIDNPFTVTLKARQLGVSWLWDVAILWDLIFFAGIDDLIYSIKEGDAIEQVNRVWDMYLSLPEHFKEGLNVIKPFGNSRPSTRLEIEHPDGRLSTLEGMPATESAGHSRVARRILFDEGAHQRFARAIWKAVIPAAGDFGGNVGMVSTAKGMGGVGEMFYELYTGAGGIDYPEVRSTFLPWHKHPRRDRKWYDSLNLDKASKAEQYPEDEDEAFLLTGSPYFDVESLAFYSREGRVDPLGYARFETYSNNLRSARLKWRGARSTEEGYWIEVYRKPEPDGEYAIGVDTATGKGQDYSVAAVIDLSDGAPVAELRMHADYVEFTRQLHFLGKWYRNAIIAPEDAGGYGSVVIAYLRDGHEGRTPYPRLYRHRNFQDLKNKVKSSYGYPMNLKTRPMVISQLGEWVNKRLFPWVTRRFAIEARTFVKHDTAPSPRHADGKNDDSVLAWGIALVMYHRYGQYQHDRKKRAFRARTRITDPLDPRLRRS